MGDPPARGAGARRIAQHRRQHPDRRRHDKEIADSAEHRFGCPPQFRLRQWPGVPARSRPKITQPGNAGEKEVTGRHHRLVRPGKPQHQPRQIATGAAPKPEQDNRSQRIDRHARDGNDDVGLTPQPVATDVKGTHRRQPAALHGAGWATPCTLVDLRLAPVSASMKRLRRPGGNRETMPSGLFSCITADAQPHGGDAIDLGLGGLVQFAAEDVGIEQLIPAGDAGRRHRLSQRIQQHVATLDDRDARMHHRPAARCQLARQGSCPPCLSPASIRSRQPETCWCRD